MALVGGKIQIRTIYHLRRYPIFVALERGLNASAYKRAFNPQVIESQI